jgi:hypothetical protein
VLPQPIETVDEMEWSINKKITVESAVPDQLNETAQLKEKEFGESFEHLRITFSNYLNSQDGGNFRNELEEVIFSKEFALYEKRRRLEIKIGPIVEGWIAEKDEDAPRQISILRKDCTVLAEKDCTGMCSWKTDSGKCLIHVSKPSTTTVEGHVGAAGGTILLHRLIEELIRFGGRRKQIFEGRVSQIASLTTAIRENDQYIIPERSYTWAEMLRNDWTKVGTDEPVFLEEMTQEPSGMTGPPEPASDLSAIPEGAVAILNPSGDEGFARLRLYPSPNGLKALLPLLNVTPEKIGLAEGQTKLDDNTMKGIVRQSLLPVIQIDLTEADPTKRVMARRAQRDRFQKYAVFVILENGSAGIIVTDPEAPALLASGDLTPGIRAIFENKEVTKTIFLMTS